MRTDPYGYPSESSEAYAEEGYWREHDRNRHGGEGMELMQPPRPEKHTMSTKHTPGPLSPALLPCPFCGGEPELKQIGNDHTKRRAVHICCTTLGCVEIRVATLHDGHAWCEGHAVRKWNSRHP